jgi:class 3 adenylate cyclase
MNKTNAAATLASVVFLKIQEFSRRPVQEQARLRAQLEAVVAVTAAQLPIENRIVLDAADGAALVVLGDPEGALRLAERALAATAAGIPLCIGINHGAVQMAPGGRGDSEMVGDGIAVAASIAEFASPARVMTSRSFRDALAHAAPEAEAHLHPAGVHTDAGLRRHELFVPDAPAAARRRRHRVALGTVIAVGLIAAGVAVRVAEVGRARMIEDARGALRHSAKEGEKLLRELRARFNL